MSAAVRKTVDVLIVGGGPVGACAGALLARSTLEHSKLDLAILEPSRPLAPEKGQPIDLRVSAFSRASEHILREAGAWARIEAGRISPYERMRVWHESFAPQSSSALVFDAADVGEPNLGYIIENRVIQAALLDAFEAAGGQIVPAELASIAIEDDLVHVETSAGPISARLIVGADGAQSAVREAIGLTADIASYRQMALVATLRTERPHELTAWQRFLSTGTLALLPLSDGSSSIVWSTDEETAALMLAAPEAQFAAELERMSDHVLGAIELASARQCFPLRRLTAARYTSSRCALVGDAAHVVHPLAGQGVNLGLLDAAALAELLLKARLEGEDVGAPRVLRAYERWRKSENEIMSRAIDGFNRFLAHGSGPLSRLAQRGLGWVNRSQELKRFFTVRALGLAGELPAAARAVPISARSDRPSPRR